MSDPQLVVTIKGVRLTARTLHVGYAGLAISFASFVVMVTASAPAATNVVYNVSPRTVIASPPSQSGTVTEANRAPEPVLQYQAQLGLREIREDGPKPDPALQRAREKELIIASPLLSAVKIDPPRSTDEKSEPIVMEYEGR